MIILMVHVSMQLSTLTTPEMAPVVEVIVDLALARSLDASNAPLPCAWQQAHVWRLVERISLHQPLSSFAPQPATISPACPAPRAQRRVELRRRGLEARAYRALQSQQLV